MRTLSRPIRIIADVVGAILLVAAVAMLALAIGTLAPAIPFLGSIGGYITVAPAHVVLPLCLAIFVLCLPFIIRFRRWVYAAVAAVLVVTFVLVSVGAADVIHAFEDEGAEVGFFRCYNPMRFEEVQVDTAVYTTSSYGDVSLDVYYKADDAADKPVILYVHGGGWTGGSRKDHAYYSRAYAHHGYVAVSVDYDLSDEERHLADSTELQLTHALGWIATNIHRYGGNADALYITGDSAGGNLALEIGYKVADGTYTQANGVALPKARALAVTYPVAYPHVFYANDDLVLGNPSKAMCTAYTGGTPDEIPAVYASICPAEHVDAATPPTMIVVGEADTMVQPIQSYHLAETLTKQGVDNRLVRLPHLNHGFDTMDASIGCQGVLALTLSWFEAH